MTIAHYEKMQEIPMQLAASCMWLLFLSIIPVLLQLVARICSLGFKILRIPPIITQGEDELTKDQNAKQQIEQFTEKISATEFDHVEDEKCSICWENFAQKESIVSIKQCQHAYHENCLKGWICRDARCPLCRCTIEKE